MPSLGLIVEGEFDEDGYSPLIRRENPLGIDILPRPCGKSVSGRFVNILRARRYVRPTLDMAVVISDAHGRNHQAWHDELQAQAAHLNLPFPVHYVVIVQELEAILLCDNQAVAAVCAERGRPIDLPERAQSPELLANPKEELVRQLAEGGVRYTRVVAGQIAERSVLDRLSYWSPSYRRFQTAVRL